MKTKGAFRRSVAWIANFFSGVAEALKWWEVKKHARDFREWCVREGRLGLLREWDETTF